MNTHAVTDRSDRNLLTVTTETRGDRALIRLVGEVDPYTAHLFRDTLQGLADHGTRHFMIDMEAMTFMDSTGVKAIADLMTSHPASVVTVVGAKPITRRVFEATGIDAHLALIR